MVRDSAKVRFDRHCRSEGFRPTEYVDVTPWVNASVNPPLCYQCPTVPTNQARHTHVTEIANEPTLSSAQATACSYFSEVMCKSREQMTWMHERLGENEAQTECRRILCISSCLRLERLLFPLEKDVHTSLRRDYQRAVC